MAVNMPPCNSCILNPQADAGAEDDNWIYAGDTAALENSVEKPVDEESAEQGLPSIGDEHQPASGAAIQ